MEIVAFFRVYRCMISSLKSFCLSEKLLQDIILFLFDDNNEQISVRIYINSLMFSAIH